MAIAKKSTARQKAIDAEITNTLFNDLTKFEMFFANHLKGIAIAGGAIVLLAGIGFGVYMQYRAAQHKAESALTAAVTETELRTVLNEYGSHPAARYARLRLVRLLSEAGQFDKADAELRLLADAGLPMPQLLRAEIDNAYRMETAGKTAEAAARLAAIGRRDQAGAAFRAEALYGAGRLYLAGNDQAKAAENLKAATALKPQVQQDPAGQEWLSLATFLLNSRIN